MKIYNKKHNNTPKDAVYIGRGSPYGNPYVIGIHGDRNEVCDLFEKFQLPKIDIEPLRDKDLVCFCAPKRCHGDIIIKKLEENRMNTTDNRPKIGEKVFYNSSFEIIRIENDIAFCTNGKAYHIDMLKKFPKNDTQNIEKLLPYIDELYHACLLALYKEQEYAKDVISLEETNGEKRWILICETVKNIRNLTEKEKNDFETI